MAYGDYWQQQDPLLAAQRQLVPLRTNQSFFPAANLNRFSDQSDLLRDADNAFYGGGQAPIPTPTPTATPAPRSYFSLNQLGAQSSLPINQQPQNQQPQYNFGFNGLRNQTQDWLRQYGWSG
jgi:hypothetical protein